MCFAFKSETNDGKKSTKYNPTTSIGQVRFKFFFLIIKQIRYSHTIVFIPSNDIMSAWINLRSGLKLFPFQENRGLADPASL